MPFATVGTSAAAIGTNATKNVSGIQLKADDDNTGDIYIGQDNTVTTDTDTTAGMRLVAGDSILIPPSLAADLSQIFAIASQASQKLYYLPVHRTV